MGWPLRRHGTINTKGTMNPSFRPAGRDTAARGRPGPIAPAAHRLRQAALGLLCACTWGAVQAATVWNEATQGDFANLGSSPTQISLQAGANLIIGTTGRTNGVVDRDYFRFTLPAGAQLDSLTVMPGTSALGISALSFIALQAGSQVTVNPTGGSPAGLLGYWHYGENDIGSDILPVMGTSPGAIGFSTPLPAGSYAFWIQDTGTGTAVYHLELGVSAVPEPASAGLLLGGLAAALGWARRQRRER